MENVDSFQQSTGWKSMKSTFYIRPANLGKTRRFFQAPRELDAFENRPTRLGKKAIQCDSKNPKLLNRKRSSLALFEKKL